VVYFVTYHLADALPAHIASQLRHERRDWLKRHPQPWDDATEREYHSMFTDRVESLIDAGYGSCILRSPGASEIVAGNLHYFDQDRYVLHDYVVMPNHVHVLFHTLTWELGRILHSWRSYTSHALNDYLHMRGSRWQGDYWDRMIRSVEHYLRVKNYIAGNAAKAGLSAREYRYWTRDIDLR
jgi:putative transposase